MTKVESLKTSTSFIPNFQELHSSDTNLIFYHVVGRLEVQLNYQRYMRSIGGNQKYSYPISILVHGSIEIHPPCL